MRVNRLHERSRRRVFLTQEIIEEQAVVRDQLAPLAVARELRHGRDADGRRIGLLARRGHAPALLRRRHAAITFRHPLIPQPGISALLLRVTAVARLPRQVVGEYCIVLRQPVELDQFLHLPPLEVHGCAGPQRLVDVQPERLAASQEVEQVLRPERFMVNEHVHRVQVHGFDAPQIPLDHLGIIRTAPQPGFEVMPVGQRNPTGGHIVDPMRLPRLAAQPEPAVTRLDEVRLRLGLPLAELMAQAVDGCPVQSHTGGDASFSAIPRQAILLDRLGFTGRERYRAVEHRPARRAFGIEELH